MSKERFVNSDVVIIRKRKDAATNAKGKEQKSKNKLLKK